MLHRLNTKNLLVILSFFLIETSLMAVPNKCLSVQRRIDSLNRRIERVQDNIAAISTNYQLTLSNIALRKESGTSSAEQRFTSTNQRCQMAYQTGKVALDQCTQSIISSLLNNGRCDSREEMNEQRFKSCKQRAEFTLSNVKQSLQNNFVRMTEVTKSRFDARALISNTQLERYKKSQTEASAELATCNVVPTPVPAA